MMDTENPVVKLCVAGAQAEFAGQLDTAKTLYRQAWDAATDDYEACIAAHYVARHQPPEAAFRWNQIALGRADAVPDARVQPFYGSLYVNMGHSYEQLGNQAAAEQYYALAATFGVVHQATE
jgi:tetratricopeptide (TPR) repeat protein